ncbi:MAG: hypothetical protein GQ564_05360 [Bacteroidales bacterium]|nr:hypothetical protein [Bacteroidales bacterium]
MRLLTAILIFILFFFYNCKRREVNDTVSVDSLIEITDSLLNAVQSHFNFTSDNFYLLIDDSIKLDSLAQNINIPDSIGFYQFLEQNISDFNEIITETQSEIFFAKDQLNSLRNDIINADISKSEYLKEINDVSEMIRFLEERIDSNIYLIDSKYNIIFFSVNDSVLL